MIQSFLNDSVVVLALIGAFVILLITSLTVGFYLKRMKTNKADGTLTHEEWDGIRKFSNNIPIGWCVIFLLLIVWGVWYIFIGYPINSYSQIGQYNEEVKKHNQLFEEKWKDISDADLVTMGDNIFQVQCVQCHGIDKSGMNGKAANLNLWGRKEHIVNVILNGSKGLNFAAGEMPPLPLEQADAEAVADFVMAEISNAKIEASEDSIAKGRDLFAVNCAACHGVDGKGMEGMEDFAPDLSKYGTQEFLQIVLSRGKNGHIGKMPSFNYVNFSDIQKKALNSFILSDE